MEELLLKVALHDMLSKKRKESDSDSDDCSSDVVSPSLSPKKGVDPSVLPPTELPLETLNKVITINVGGTKFSTYLGTIANGQSNFLRALLDKWLCLSAKEQGEIFIDRNPASFGLILDTLRGQPPLAQYMSPLKHALYQRECTFYGLQRSRSLIKITRGKVLKSRKWFMKGEKSDALEFTVNQYCVLVGFNASLGKGENTLQVKIKKGESILTEDKFVLRAEKKEFRSLELSHPVEVPPGLTLAIWLTQKSNSCYCVDAENPIYDAPHEFLVRFSDCKLSDAIDNGTCVGVGVFESLFFEIQ